MKIYRTNRLDLRLKSPPRPEPKSQRQVLTRIKEILQNRHVKAETKLLKEAEIISLSQLREQVELCSTTYAHFQAFQILQALCHQKQSEQQQDANLIYFSSKIGQIPELQPLLTQLPKLHSNKGPAQELQFCLAEQFRERRTEAYLQYLVQQDLQKQTIDRLHQVQQRLSFKSDSQYPTGIEHLSGETVQQVSLFESKGPRTKQLGKSQNMLSVNCRTGFSSKQNKFDRQSHDLLMQSKGLLYN